MNTRLSGLQKAGVLMISLGAEESAKVFDCLTPEERDFLGSEIVKLRHVDELTCRNVLEEVREIIVRRHHEPRPSAAFKTSMESEEPFKWLESMDADEVASMLGRERPQNIALVLAHISPRSAADVLSCLSETLRNQVVRRLVTMKPVSPEAIEAVDEAMRRKAGKADTRPSHEGLMSIIGKATGGMASAPFTFAVPEDMLGLSDTEMKTALAAIDSGDMCLALRVAGDDLRSAVLANVSGEAAHAFQREIDSTAQIRVRDIERAQTRIVEALNRLFAADRALEASVG